MWLFSLYRRVLYFWIAYSQVRANLYDNIFSLDIRHNSNMMYIYKRPYVHFPTIFLRQNCDHMCIIKIVFNPLPMKIFWKKNLLCIFSFWKIKKVLCILLKSVFCIKLLCWPTYIQCWKLMNHAISFDWTCEGFFIRILQKKSSLLSTILNIKVLSLSCSYHEPKNNGIKFGVPGILFHICCWVTLVF